MMDTGFTNCSGAKGEKKGFSNAQNSVDIRRCRRCHVVEMNVVVCCERMGGRKCVDCWEECWTKYESLSVGQFRGE